MDSLSPVSPTSLDQFSEITLQGCQFACLYTAARQNPGYRASAFIQVLTVRVATHMFLCDMHHSSHGLIWSYDDLIQLVLNCFHLWCAGAVCNVCAW